MAELAEFTEKYGVKISELATHNMTLTQLGFLVHIGLVAGAEVKGKEYKKTPRQTMRIMDRTKGLLKMCMRVFVDGINTAFDDDDEDEENTESETDKKK